MVDGETVLKWAIDLQPNACNSSHIVAVRVFLSRPSVSPLLRRFVDHAYNGRVRYLGVDPGGRRMGFAVGDDTTGVASPLEIVPFESIKRAARRVAAAALKVGAVRVVIGLPILEDGSRGPACQRSERLAEEVEALGLEVALQSELLSTDEARRRARAAGRAPRRPVDDFAAQVLLEDHLAADTPATIRER